MGCLARVELVRSGRFRKTHTMAVSGGSFLVFASSFVHATLAATAVPLSNSFRGCFTFLLYGTPSPNLFASTAAGMLSLLNPRRTQHRTVLLLTEQWWDTPYESTFRNLAATVRRTRQLQNVSCSGPFRKGTHFVGTYTAFEAWGLSDMCDAVVYMDSDLQVMANMDHLFTYMQDHPAVVTAGVQLHWPEMNTGVWLLRPAQHIRDDLVAYVQKPDVPYPCGKGFQLAAKAFFPRYFGGRPRWFERLPDRYNCMDPGMTSCLKSNAETPPELDIPGKVYVVHWPGDLKPDHPVLWNATSKAPQDYVNWAPSHLPAPYHFKGGMHPIRASALRQWHGNYEHAMRLLGPTANQRATYRQSHRESAQMDGAALQPDKSRAKQSAVQTSAAAAAVALVATVALTAWRRCL